MNRAWTVGAAVALVAGGVASGIAIGRATAPADGCARTLDSFNAFYSLALQDTGAGSTRGDALHMDKIIVGNARCFDRRELQRARQELAPGGLPGISVGP